jgi:hypothetical protein
MWLLPNRDCNVLQIFVGLCNTGYTTTFMFSFLQFIHLYSWYNFMSKNVINSNLILIVNVVINSLVLY